MKPGFVCFLNERLTRDATQRVVESHLICTQAGDYKEFFSGPQEWEFGGSTGTWSRVAVG